MITMFKVGKGKGASISVRVTVAPTFVRFPLIYPTPRIALSVRKCVGVEVGDGGDDDDDHRHRHHHHHHCHKAIGGLRPAWPSWIVGW